MKLNLNQIKTLLDVLAIYKKENKTCMLYKEMDELELRLEEQDYYITRSDMLGRGLYEYEIDSMDAYRLKLACDYMIDNKKQDDLKELRNTLYKASTEF